MLSQGWGWVHCEGERSQKSVMGPGQLLAGAGWMTVGLCMVTVHSREHLPIPSPASCLVPYATACPMCRDSSRGGLSALTELICPRCQRCPGGLACCSLRSSATLGAAVNLGVCTETAGALQVPKTLRQSHCYQLCLQTPGLNICLSVGDI